MSSDFSAKFFIKPEVDPQAANKAEAKLDQVVAQAAAAAKAGNAKALRDLNIQAHRMLKKGGNPTLTVEVDTEFSSTTAGLQEVKRMSASALDGYIKDYQKAVDIQGESALNVKKEIKLQQQNLSELKKKQEILGRGSKAYKKNAEAQKLNVQQTEKLQAALSKVRTLASMKGQLRDESQKLSMMNQYNLGLNKQGQLVTTLNQKWVAQRQVVMGLSGQVAAAGAAAQGFGAKVAAAGQKMQMAFGWIAAVVAGMTAIAGSIGAITGRAKDVQAIRLTFDGLGQSVEAQNAILGSARNIALSYGVSLRKVEGAFRRLGPAILESGGSLKDTEGAIKSIAARTTMLGLNTEQTGRYIEAFAQVMGKGKLQSEELNQQFSELDGGLRGQLKNWLAANKGITDFEAAMKNGEITSGVFLQAFEAINEEIRQKFLRSIGDTQTAIETLGQKGGMTLNQLNAKLQTLTSIGLESVGEALAPLGKELMKIYAAFVQVFTKIATEMPGIQKAFQFLGGAIGVVLKGAVNMILVSFGLLMQALNAVILLVRDLYNLLKKIPGLGYLLDGVEDGIAGMNKEFDGAVDNWARLSDETTGAKSELEKYNDEMKNLEAMRKKGEITEEEYYKKSNALLVKKQQAEQKAAQQSLEIEENKYKKMLDAQNAYIERSEQLAEREKDAIKEATAIEVDAIDRAIEARKESAKVASEGWDKQIAKVKEAAREQKRANEDALTATREQMNASKREFEDKKRLTKEYYDGLKKEMDEAHGKAMTQLDERIAAMEASQKSELNELDDGPAKQRLERAKTLELERQISTERDQMKKLELQAQLESMNNSRKKAELEKQFAKDLAFEEKKKADLAKQQAEEKAALLAEEKAAKKEIADEERKTMRGLADAIAALNKQKRDAARKEQDEVAAIKKAKDAAAKKADQDVDALEKKKDAANKKEKQRIDAIDKKIEQQKRKVEDVKAAILKQAGAYDSVSGAVDSVTNGALERQLQKVLRIKRELATMESSSGGSSNDGFRFTGGPVKGGGTYTVNELGREGFLSASGKLSQINAPAFGDWKAPSSGTVIPAHIWKNLKNTQGPASVKMPSNTNPGNGVARAISTISNISNGNNFTNNVTVQAANPVQAANNMMVEMTRLKRRRLR